MDQSWVTLMSARAARGELLPPPEDLLHEAYDAPDDGLGFARGFLVAMLLTLLASALVGALGWAFWHGRPW